MRRGGAWASNLSIALVALYLAMAFALEPDPRARGDLHVRLVLTLGYGHLLASVVRARTHDTVGTATRAARWWALLLAAYLAYAELCRRWPPLPAVLVAISAWHTIENDRAIRRCARDAPRPIAALARSWRSHAIDAALSVALAGSAAAVARRVHGVDPTDVVAAFTLHHVVTWLVLMLGRAREARALPSMLRRLAWLHAPMALLCAAAMGVLARGGALPEPLVAVAETLLSPGTYLFWAAVHVAHTLLLRRRSGTA